MVTTAIFYPETDGLPLPDGEYQSPLLTDTVTPLRLHFRNVEGNANTRISPDCYVVFDLSEAALYSLSQEGNNTYLLWEVEKPPDYVMEIGSSSTARRDLNFKRELYADLGVGEYWRYDQTGGDFYGEPLVGERLVGGEYERMEMRREPDGSVWGHSDALNLDLWWRDGDLRYWDPVQGKWLRTPEEDLDGRLAAEARAVAERDARIVERNARLAADARNAQLEAELRRLRQVPPS